MLSIPLWKLFESKEKITSKWSKKSTRFSGNELIEWQNSVNKYCTSLDWYQKLLIWIKIHYVQYIHRQDSWLLCLEWISITFLTVSGFRYSYERSSMHCIVWRKLPCTVLFVMYHYFYFMPISCDDLWLVSYSYYVPIFQNEAKEPDVSEFPRTLRKVFSWGLFFAFVTNFLSSHSSPNTASLHPLSPNTKPLPKI